MINYHNIQVNFKSIGYGTHDTKEITGTIKLNIKKLIQVYLQEREITVDYEKHCKTLVLNQIFNHVSIIIVLKQVLPILTNLLLVYNKTITLD